MFSSFRIPVDLLTAARIERVTDEEARSKYGITGSASSKMGGIVFPYFVPDCDHRVTARVRRDHPEVDGEGKPKGKYLSPYGDGRHLYFPPQAKELLEDPETVIIVVEAEKSALALMAWAKRQGRKLFAIGLGGCWCWRGRIGKDRDATGARVDVTGPLPDLDECNGRTVYVCWTRMQRQTPKCRQQGLHSCESYASAAAKCWSAVFPWWTV